MEMTKPAYTKPIYLAGSLRNEDMMKHLHTLNEYRFPNVFMDWYAAGPKADDHWREYWQEQGVGYREALGKPNSINTYMFDKKHIDASDIMILAAPAGKSGHMELGYAIGSGKIGIYFFPEEPKEDRWDIMLQFATHICIGYGELIKTLRKIHDR